MGPSAELIESCTRIVQRCGLVEDLALELEDLVRADHYRAWNGERLGFGELQCNQVGRCAVNRVAPLDLTLIDSGRDRIEGDSRVPQQGFAGRALRSKDQHGLGFSQ